MEGPSTEEWINRLFNCYKKMFNSVIRNDVLKYATTWMTLKILCLVKEGSHKKSHIIWFLSCGLSRKGKPTETGRDYWLPGHVERKEWGATYCNGHEGLFWVMDKVWNCTRVVLCRTVSAPNATELHTLGWLTVYSMNFASIKKIKS